MSPSIRVHALPAETERLDRPRALDGLGERGVDDRVRRALAQVAGLGPARGTSAARPPGSARRAAHRQQHPPPTSVAPTSVTTVVISAIVHSGRAHRTDQPSCSMSREVRVSRSPDAGALDHADRERQRVGDEVLAQVGQDLLADARREVAGLAGEHRLHDQEHREHDRHVVDVVAPWCRSRRPAPARRAAAAPPVRRPRRARAARVRSRVPAGAGGTARRGSAAPDARRRREASRSFGAPAESWSASGAMSWGDSHRRAPSSASTSRVTTAR